MGGSSQADTKTTTQNLTPEQQSLVGLAQPNYQSFAASTPTLPGSAGVAQFDPLQTEGQNQVLGATGAQGNIVSGAGNANQWLTSGASLDPSTNPSLAAWQKSAVQPIYQNLSQNILPQLSANASTGSGGISANLGGSRQGIAEGIATEGANQAAANTEANIANQGYSSGLNALLQSIGQAPGTAAAQTIPGVTTSTVGDIRQGQAQQNISADTAASQFAQWLPLLKAQLLTQGASGTPGGSATSVGTSNTNPSLFSQIVGGASAAGGLLGSAGKAATGLSDAGGLSGLLTLLAL
jgi:hypothetical protein